MRHLERHRSDRIGWLRAGVMGANDGIVSTASLVMGVAASGAPRAAVLVASVAGLVAGAMSMAAGEYVSVSSQADTENADLARESRELASDPEGELEEMTRIYEGRGLPPALAADTARALTAHDALGAHSRDELGISERITARPLLAAGSSAASFTLGALLPLLVAAFSSDSVRAWAVAASTIVFLAALGIIGARIGGARPLRPALRVMLWGAFAMGITALIGRVVGTAV